MTTASPKCCFGADHHTYSIGPRVVPSVTQIMAGTLDQQYWGCTEWHLQRGRAIHACAAMVARVQTFDADERLDGYILAVETFLREIKPDIAEIETPMFSERYQFAGTPDLIGMMRLPKIGMQRVVFDYKHTLTGTVPVQLGGYSILDGDNSTYGFGVELHEDGTYKLSMPVRLASARNEFLACLTVYNIKRRIGALPKEGE